MNFSKFENSLLSHLNWIDLNFLDVTYSKLSRFYGFALIVCFRIGVVLLKNPSALYYLDGNTVVLWNLTEQDKRGLFIVCNLHGVCIRDFGDFISIN